MIIPPIDFEDHLSHFVNYNYLLEYFDGKSVAIVGSAPNSIGNGDKIESCDIVIRVNNYKIVEGNGKRCDVHYSFYGTSIRKKASELRADGVNLCLCKCPNSQPIHSDWHIKNKKIFGIDFRYIYEFRANFWFCPTWIPDNKTFVDQFNALNWHIPSTGLACIMLIQKLTSTSIYVTGFDFFSSGLHNVDEAWKPGDPRDPIGHSPENEKNWLKEILAKDSRLQLDASIERLL